MRAEKQILTKEYAARLNGSPFFIVVGYQGLKVSHLTELRKRLKTAGAEVHVVKNSVFLIAAKEAGVAELNGSLAGQMAVVTGQKDISAAAKARIARNPSVPSPGILDHLSPSALGDHAKQVCLQTCETRSSQTIRRKFAGSIQLYTRDQ